MEGGLPKEFSIIETNELERIFSETNLRKWLYFIYSE